MRSTSIVMIALLLGAGAWVRAQAAPPTPGAPEMFSATAQAKNAVGAVSGTLEVRLSRYTPDFDRTTVETALRQGGYPRFVTALRSAPEVGQLVIGGSQPYAIRYARQTVAGGRRTIVIVTDRPVFFLGGNRADAAPRKGFEVAVVQMQVDEAGRGQGTMAAAARVRPDGDGGVLLDDYAEEPIVLTAITRKAS